MVQSITTTAIRERLIASALIKYCKPLVQSGLISQEAFAVLKDFASLFPLSLTSFFCFEIPLHQEEETADFLFCVSHPAVLVEALRYDKFLKQLVNKNSFYKLLLDFSKMWQDGNPALRSIENIWLEFDYAEMKLPVANPCFFFAPEKQMNALRKVHVTDVVFQAAALQPLSKETARTLLHILSGIPRPGWVSQIGKMLSRNATSLRVFIQHVAKDGVGELLKIAGYQHTDDERFDCLLKLCYSFADQVDVDIDIEESGQVGPIAGLECSFNDVEKALAFLYHIYLKGICSKHKYDALFLFLKNVQLKKGEDYQPFLSHFKMVYQPDKAIKAKAYIGYVESHKASSIIRTQIL